MKNERMFYKTKRQCRKNRHKAGAMRFPAFLLSFALAVALLGSVSLPVHAEELTLESPSCILMEASTGTVIYEKNADKQLRPASVTKVMTLLLAFEAIDSGQMKLSDTVTISDHAASMEGSRCFFEAGEQQTVEDIIKCIIIASGNDTAVAMAEHIAGSEEAFVELMNTRAKELGMENTHFENACGLEAEGHLTTARDIAIMSRELIGKHPAVFSYSTIWMDTITHKTKRGEKEFTLANTNKFLKQYTGATGLKTGYTSVAKYSMSATAKRNGVDLIAVVMSAETKEIRNKDAGRLLDYGFAKCRVFRDEKVLSGMESLDENRKEIPIADGKQSMIKYICENGFSHVFLNNEDTSRVVKEPVLSDLQAPITTGTKIGEIRYRYDNQIIGAVPLFAAEDVPRTDFSFCFRQLLHRFMRGNVPDLDNETAA